MPLDRRHFMMGVAATAGAGVMSQHINIAQAASPKTGRQVPGVYRTKIGGIEVTSIFDGAMPMSPDIIINPDLGEVNLLKDKAFYPKDTMPGYLNTFIINTGNKLILVDTGAGNYAPTTGHLTENLKAAGLVPAQIDEIYLTHAHPDHVNGLLDASGHMAFPKAKIRLSDEELSFWFDDAKKTSMPGKESAFDAARKTLTPYKDAKHIETFKLGDDLGAGVTSVALRGHTPGHGGFRIADGSDQFLIWGDIVHMQAFQFTHPEWSLVFDIDPQQAIATRKKILDEVTTDRIRIGGMHLSFPGIGHISKSGSGYAYVPQVWEA